MSRAFSSVFLLRAATKESSFVHTLMAASVAHEVAKACSEDRLSGDCACKANHHERGVSNSLKRNCVQSDLTLAHPP